LASTAPASCGETKPAGTAGKQPAKKNASPSKTPASKAGNQAEGSKSIVIHGRGQVIEFSAGWCVPCKKFAPTFEKMKTDFSDKADFITADIDDKAQADLVNKYAVESVPTVIVVDGKGKVIYRHSGIPKETDLTAQLHKL
jgi:thiol-disulfide isomerase/thioredoxin